LAETPGGKQGDRFAFAFVEKNFMAIMRPKIVPRILQNQETALTEASISKISPDVCCTKKQKQVWKTKVCFENPLEAH
jgi:hypothetical protein